MSFRQEPLSINSRDSFTLIELLVVIAIVAVLSVVVILVLNPAQLLAQARDSNRLNDLASLNTALSLFQTDVAGGSLGTSSIVYVSVADSSSTCGNLGLPTLPSGWTYNCVSTTTLRNTDGTGWVPVNLNSISARSPLSSLPADPTNATSSGLYYTYVAGSTTFELTALLESAKYQSQEASDGGVDPVQYERGTSLSLSPFAHALVGYWNFDEGAGTSAQDTSGGSNTGTWTGTGTHYAAGKVGAYAGQFNGTDDKVTVNDSSVLKPTSGMTVSAWIYKTAVANGGLINNNAGYVNSTIFLNGNTPYAQVQIAGTSQNVSSSGVSLNAWHHIVYEYDGTKEFWTIDGVRQTLYPRTGSINAGTNPRVIGFYNPSSWFNGLIDDMRIYNRALSASEIQALYNATR